MDIIDNENQTSDKLNKGELHLNPRGLGLLAINFSRRIKKFAKATQSDDMPIKIIKTNSDIFSKFFQANLNNTTEKSTFSEQLKYADVKPVFKKDFLNKKNHRPTSILPNVSKTFERCKNE